MFIIATFVLFTVVVAVISWYKTRDDKLNSQEGYFLAGILCMICMLAVYWLFSPLGLASML